MVEANIEGRLKAAIEREVLLARLGGGSVMGTFSRVVHSRANMPADMSLVSLSSPEEEAKLRIFAQRLIAKAALEASAGKS